MQAARGAGLEWGLAEESGRTAYWLAAHGFPLLFSAVLTARDIFDVVDDDELRCGTLTPKNSDKVLCPLVTGTYLSDCGKSPHAPRRFSRLAQPLLLLPFTARIATPEYCLRQTWASVECITDGTNLWLSKENELDLTATMADVLIETVPLPTTPPIAHATQHGEISPQEWDKLKTLAATIWVPESEESRKFGAGGADDSKNS